MKTQNIGLERTFEPFQTPSFGKEAGGWMEKAAKRMFIGTNKHQSCLRVYLSSSTGKIRCRPDLT